MLERILNYFGNLGEQEIEFLKMNESKLDDTQSFSFIQKLFEKFPDKRKKPTVSDLNHLLCNLLGTKPKIYFWSVCMECGTEYAYTLPMCPGCYSRGFECRTYAVKKSEFLPPAKVVRYNKEYFEENEPNCYDCPEKELSYCKNFGNENWNCRDLSNCKCARCCVFIKKENQKLAQSETKTKLSFARPLKN